MPVTGPGSGGPAQSPGGGAGVPGAGGPAHEYFCENAWLGGPTTERDVLVRVRGAWVESVEVGAAAPPGATRLAGLTVPGFANAHSHAFHRALRGRVQAGRGDFWTWREQMYEVAAALTPDNYFRLARAAFAEMALAGITAVGEFHYVHHALGGGRYADPNDMGAALLAAAAQAGVRITLIDTCYLENSPGSPPQGPQSRFSDGSATAWAERVAALRGLAGPGRTPAKGRTSPAARRPGAPGAAEGELPAARLGVAVHSVRAVPPAQVALVAAYARHNDVPLHFHLSEQAKENDLTQAAYGLSPTEVLDEAGALGDMSTAVHATHLSVSDVSLLSGSRTSVCMCPTTEQDLADGTGPARALAFGGSSLCLGTDSHAVVDPFLEMRGLEYDERLASGLRGNWPAHELFRAVTAAGHAAIGWPGAGTISAGAVADLVTIDIGSPRLAGAVEDHLLELTAFAACAADVHHVVNAGRTVVAGGRHLLIDDVAGALRSAVTAVVRR